MPEITITVTDEQMDFIERVTTLMTEQNNRATQYPMFYVYEKEEKESPDGSGRIAYYDEDWNETDTYTTPDGITYKLDEENDVWQIESHESELPDDFENNIAGDDFVDRNGVKLARVHLEEVDTPVINVGPFLTEQAANLHIESNHYHYTKPFTYVNSLWRNYEMQDLIKLLFTIAGKPVPSQYQ